MSEINRAIGERPALEWVSVELIYVDSNYQRDLRPALVAKILRAFSWAKFGAVVLSRQPDGRHTIVEGQHRWEAAKLHPYVTEVPAVIVSHDGTAGEAQSFLAINRDRANVSSVEQYWAGLTAGDEKVAAISRVLLAAGCDVVPSLGVRKPHLTNSVGAIGRSIERYGDEATRRALHVIRTAWPKEKDGLRGTLITALARIIRANREAVRDEDLVTAIRRESLARLTAGAEAIRKLSGGSADAAIAKAIVELHNKGKRTNVIYFGEAR